jgi:hypothetical protein
MVGVAVLEPREPFPRLLQGQCAFGKIAADLWVAVECVQIIEIGRHQAPQPLGLEDRHAVS